MLRSTLLALPLVLMTTVAQAQLYVYPANGQSPQQEQQDEYQCYLFGKNETGFDPTVAQPPSAAPQQQQGSGFLHGMFGGALLGVAVGAIAGNAAEGAAIGAASGGLFGGMRAQQSRNEQQQLAQQQQAAYQTNLDNYNRAYTACLQGRGYTVQ
jgi:predicted lipid-binding transport protein (Tim44 family)